jgi:RHS repeat-associated protein
VWSWANDDPFGANVPNENPSALGDFTCNLRLPGQYFDRETNLHYNYFRDYDPLIGRYVEADPIGLLGGINLHTYVGSKPTMHTDPMGLDWFKPATARSVVGREDTIIEPGGRIALYIENHVPAGYEFGVFHDHFVAQAVAAGWPDLIVNVPTMQYFYWRAVATETFGSVGNAVSKFRLLVTPKLLRAPRLLRAAQCP